MSQPPPNKNDPKPKQEPPNPLLEEYQLLSQKYGALSQILWNLVQVAAPNSHEIEVLEQASDPLWVIAFEPSSEKDSKRIKILACTLKPITEQEKKRVVRLLRGTTMHMMDALKQLDLPHPPSYVEAQIKAQLEWKCAAITSDTKNHPTGTVYRWESVRAATIGETLKNIVAWPK